MRLLREHKRIALAAAGLVVLASFALPASAGLTTTGRLSLASRYGRLAHQAIARRQAMLRGRTLAAGTAPDPLALIAMRDTALEMASLNGDARPHDGQVFSSTRNFAEQVISGDTVNTDQPAYVAIFRGNFVGYLASVPPGGHFPTGHVMTIVFDARTLEVTDWGLVDRVPPTAALGASSSLGF